jgi:glycosyltransferase involved in cell wall biosynthesis
LQEHKGHAYLIEAATKVAAAYPNLKWVIAGRATGTEQLAYLNQLTDRIRTADLGDRILLPGFVADCDMVSLFRGALALVHPAVTEGYGLVLLEAMAHRLPVIAAAASGPAGIIEDEADGLLVPVRDSDALATAMIRLIEDSSLRQRLTQQATQSVAERSVDGMLEKTLSVYRSMLGRPSL